MPNAGEDDEAPAQPHRVARARMLRERMLAAIDAGFDRAIYERFLTLASHVRAEGASQQARTFIEGANAIGQFYLTLRKTIDRMPDDMLD